MTVTIARGIARPLLALLAAVMIGCSMVPNMDAGTSGCSNATASDLGRRIRPPPSNRIRQASRRSWA